MNFLFEVGVLLVVACIRLVDLVLVGVVMYVDVYLVDFGYGC